MNDCAHDSALSHEGWTCYMIIGILYYIEKLAKAILYLWIWKKGEEYQNLAGFGICTWDYF
jgi:hypothetical protein